MAGAFEANNIRKTTSVEKTSLNAWLVVFTAALFFFYEFIQMNMISSLNQDLMRAFHVDATKLGFTQCCKIAHMI